MDFDCGGDHVQLPTYKIGTSTFSLSLREDCTNMHTFWIYLLVLLYTDERVVLEVYMLAVVRVQ